MIAHVVIAAIIALGTVALAADSVESANLAVKQAESDLREASLYVRKTGKLPDVRGKILGAEAQLRQASRVLAQANHYHEAALAWARASDCLRMVNQWRDALASYRDALDFVQKHSDPEAEAKILLGIEKCERLGLQDHQAALEALRQGLRAASTDPKLVNVRADFLEERAELEWAQGLIEQTLATLEEVKAILGSGYDDERRWPNLLSSAAAHQALAQKLMSQYTELPFTTAMQWRTCEEVAQSAAAQLAQAQSDFDEAAALAKARDYDFIFSSANTQAKAVGLLAQSLKTIVRLKTEQRGIGRDSAQRETGRPQLVANEQGKRIEAELLDDPLPISDPQKRQEFIAATRDEFRNMPAANTALWRQRYLEGQMFEAENKLDAALRCYRQSAELVEQERQTVPTDATRAAFAADRTEVYDHLSLLLLKLNQYPEAFAWLERSRARALTDLLSSKEINFPSEKERALFAQWMDLRSQKSAALKANDRIAEIDAKYDKTLEQMQRESPRLLELVNSKPVEYAALQEDMRRNNYDLAYFSVQASRIVLWHIGPHHSKALAYLCLPPELLGFATSLLNSLKLPNTPFDADSARALYFYLAEPAYELMETKHLVLVLPAQLQGLPFQVLLNPKTNQYFGEEVALSFAPSASLAVRLQFCPKLAGSKFLVAVHGLEYGERDARAISDLYPDHTVLEGANATIAELTKEAAGKSVVHIAAHGKYDEREPMLSYIRLQAGPGSGELSAAQMFALPLQNAKLVSLAACSAGRAESGPNNEVFGFVRSLLYAGAQNIILPLWDVDDEATAFWFGAFYKAAMSLPLAEAARQANIQTRAHPKFGSHPRLWSGLMLVGR